jgi:hypothetical protein
MRRNSITPSRAFFTSGVSVLMFIPGATGIAHDATGLGLFSTCKQYISWEGARGWQALVNKWTTARCSGRQAGGSTRTKHAPRPSTSCSCLLWRGADGSRTCRRKGGTGYGLSREEPSHQHQGCKLWKRPCILATEVTTRTRERPVAAVQRHCRAPKSCKLAVHSQSLLHVIEGFTWEYRLLLHHKPAARLTPWPLSRTARLP